MDGDKITEGEFLLLSQKRKLVAEGFERLEIKKQGFSLSFFFVIVNQHTFLDGHTDRQFIMMQCRHKLRHFSHQIQPLQKRQIHSKKTSIERVPFRRK